MPPLYARPRHAAPRDTTKIRAALVPAVLLASTGSALGGLAAGASADGRVLRVTTAASSLPELDVQAMQANRNLVVEQSEARASRDRARDEAEAAAAAAEAARVAEEARKAEEARLAAEAEAARIAALPKYARPGTGRITSSFGPRWGRMHSGLDIASGAGNRISAAAAGTVMSAGWEGGYGYAVRIKHDDGTVTLYAHNASLTVSKGQRVEAGQQIAREGSTGNSTGPHVHFEVRIGGNAVNPRTWLRERGVNM